MARKAAAKKPTKKAPTKRARKTGKAAKPPRSMARRAFIWVTRGGMAATGFAILATFFYAFVDPYSTPYMFSEGRRLGQHVDQAWVPLEEISPHMARSVVAAEDANFCLHWGFDMAAIRQAIAGGASRGGSTISQQTVKNVYLWQGRSWTRKALEALMTPMVEAIWTKRRIVEVYLNVIEFDEGVFGVDAAAHHYFRVAPADLTATQAARLAAILPDPKGRSASNPSRFVRNRTASIRDGAATILADGRADCFEP